MSRRTAVIAALVAAVAAGCGSQSIGGQPTFADDHPPTRAELEAALLTEDDVPAGFVAVSIPDEEDGVIQEANCRWVFEDGPADPDEVATAEVTFIKDTDLLIESVSSYKSADVVAQGYAGSLAVLDECSTFTERLPDGSVNTYHMEPTDFPDRGDRSLAVRATATIGGIRIGINLVTFQVDTCLAMVATGGWGSADAALLESATESVVEHLDDVC